MLASLKGLCPSDVLSVPLQTLWVRGPKSKVGVRKAQAMTEGTVPCYTSGEAVYKVTEYLVDGDYIFVNDGGSADFKYHEGKAYYTDHVVAITTKESIKAKYLYYYLQNTKEYIDANLFRGSGLKNLSITELGNYLIPLPPLPVQEEIVRILDTFTELIAELKAELKAELAARKKQYEFYRENLLGFEGRTDVEWKKLGEVCGFQNGYAFKSSKFNAEGTPILRITNIQDGQICSEGCVYFNKQDYAVNLDRYRVCKDAIVVAMSGATTGKIGYNYTDVVYYLNQRVGMFKPHAESLNKRYLYHWLLSMSSYILSISMGTGAQPNLSTESMMGITIPIPSLAEQAEIVAILDQFDTLTNSLTEGIPAEIALRQKQYEFYREKLLTF